MRFSILILIRVTLLLIFDSLLSDGTAARLPFADAAVDHAAAADDDDDDHHHATADDAATAADDAATADNDELSCC